MATYGQIAALLGEPWNARVVGWAMHKAPEELKLPCHRVVNKSGGMGPGYLFAPGEQRKLLEDEGVTFTEDGWVDMEKHLWDPFVHMGISERADRGRKAPDRPHKKGG